MMRQDSSNPIMNPNDTSIIIQFLNSYIHFYQRNEEQHEIDTFSMNSLILSKTRNCHPLIPIIVKTHRPSVSNESVIKCTPIVCIKHLLVLI